MATKQDKKTPPAQLYLLSPVLGDAAAFAPLLEAALDAAEVACVLVRIGADDPGAARRAVMALARSAQERGVALLVDADTRTAVRAGADGVHLRTSGANVEASVSEAVTAMKPDRIVGVGGLRTRDNAMLAGEQDVDYVMFGEPSDDAWVAPFEERLERAAWWSEIFNVPCVVYAANLEEVRPLAETGVDFVAIGEAVWNDQRGPAAAVRDAAAALRAAVRRPE